MAAHDVALGRDGLAGREFGPYVPPDLDDLSGELVPNDERGLAPSASPFIPVGNVEVGAADAGVAHANEHVGGATRRLGDVRDFQSGPGFAFYDCSQRMLRMNPPSTCSAAPVM